MSDRTADPGGLRALLDSLYTSAASDLGDWGSGVEYAADRLKEAIALTPEATAPCPECGRSDEHAAPCKAATRARTADPGGLNVDALPDYNPYPNPFDEDGDFLDSTEYAARTADPSDGLRAAREVVHTLLTIHVPTGCDHKSLPHLCEVAAERIAAVLAQPETSPEWPKVDCAVTFLHDHKTPDGFYGPWEGPHSAWDDGDFAQPEDTRTADPGGLRAAVEDVLRNPATYHDVGSIHERLSRALTPEATAPCPECGRSDEHAAPCKAATRARTADPGGLRLSTVDFALSEAHVSAAKRDRVLTTLRAALTPEATAPTQPYPFCGSCHTPGHYAGDGKHPCPPEATAPDPREAGS